MSYSGWDSSDSYSGESYWYSGFGYARRYTPEEMADALRPLITHLEKYDHLRAQYEGKGVHLDEIEELSAHLSRKVKVMTPDGAELPVSLHDPRSLRHAITEIGDRDLRLTVRSRESQMPSYYICRTHSGYWNDYGFILEDLYTSPGYPMLDSRFVKLMRNGHEVFFLRLSDIRQRLLYIAKGKVDPTPEAIDRKLKYVGEHIFQVAWHEDQRLAFGVAQFFDIPQFRHAIELLYLCLSGDLCYLRNSNSDFLRVFFKKVYPQPAIGGLLQLLGDIDGGEISKLQERALEMYAQLTKSFSKLLHVEAEWGRTGANLPIYKLVFANTTRMNALGEKLKDVPDIRLAADNLNARAATIVNDLLTTSTMSPN